MNRIVLVGRLENTPEIRFTSSGIPVSNFSLSVRRSHPNSEGIWEKDIFRIVTWRKLAETCCKYLEKGRWIAVDGKLQNRYFNTSNNERRVMVEIHADDIRFLDFRPKHRDQRDERDERDRDNEMEEQESEVNADDRSRVNGDNREREVRQVSKTETAESTNERVSNQDGDYNHYLQDEEGTPLDMNEE